MSPELKLQKLKLQFAIGCIEMIELAEQFQERGIDTKEQNDIVIEEQLKAYTRTMTDFITTCSLSKVKC